MAEEVWWRGWDGLGLLVSAHCSVRFASRFRLADDPEDIREGSNRNAEGHSILLKLVFLRSLPEIRSTPRRAPNAQGDPIFLAYSRDPHDTQLLP